MKKGRSMEDQINGVLKEHRAVYWRRNVPQAWELGREQCFNCGVVAVGQ